MDHLAYGFWGCFFGATALMLGGAAVAFARSLRRISLNAALSAMASSFFAFAFLGGLPINDQAIEARVLAHVAMLVSAFMAYLLFSILGSLGNMQAERAIQLTLAALVVSGAVLGWGLPARYSLTLGVGIACLLGAVGFGVAMRSVHRRQRLAGIAATGVFCMWVAIAGLGWISLAGPQIAWPVHAVTALAGTGYVVAMAAALWVRYAYLLELNQVMAMGPSYDPVTRLRSLNETSQLLAHIFKSQRSDTQLPAAAPEPDPGAGNRVDDDGALELPAEAHSPGKLVGVLVVSIGNLYALERLHGKAAINHALFVCAGRLRLVVPAHVELGRFSSDGFVLLMRDCSDSGQLVSLAHQVNERLARPVALNTSLDHSRRESEQTRWRADLGTGVLLVSRPAPEVHKVLSTVKAMSRIAMTYSSRVAWFDEASGEAVELPSPEAA